MNITWDQVFCRFTGQKYQVYKEKLKVTLPDITTFLGLEHEYQKWILCGCLEECGETVEKLLQELDRDSRDGGWSTETAPELKSQAEYSEWLFGTANSNLKPHL
jgi:hypothetical protein